MCMPNLVKFYGTGRESPRPVQPGYQTLYIGVAHVKIGVFVPVPLATSSGGLRIGLASYNHIVFFRSCSHSNRAGNRNLAQIVFERWSLSAELR